MKYAIVGSREFKDYDLLKEHLDAIPDITEIISGGAIGADKLAERYASENGIEVVIFKPDWARYGRGAGPVRNKLIISSSEKVIAFYNGVSKGTLSSINFAKKQNKEIKIVRF